RESLLPQLAELGGVATAVLEERSQARRSRTSQLPNLVMDARLTVGIRRELPKRIRQDGGGRLVASHNQRENLRSERRGIRFAAASSRSVDDPNGMSSRRSRTSSRSPAARTLVSLSATICSIMGGSRREKRARPKMAPGPYPRGDTHDRTARRPGTTSG